MKAKNEVVLGVLLWAGGIAFAIGIALSLPPFTNNGVGIGGGFAVIGLILIWSGLSTLFRDDFEEEIKKGYKQEKKNGNT